MFNLNFIITLLIMICFNFTSASDLLPSKFKMLESYQITGLIPDITDSYGVAFRDFTDDGYPDIYLVCFRNLNRLLINNGGIIPFIDRTIYSGLGGYLMPRGETNLELGACAADYDNDGHPDIFLAGWGKTYRLYHNLGNLSFEDATDFLNLKGILDANQGLWLDADNDGYLDIYITDEHSSNRFFKNNKNGYFNEAIWTNTFLDSAVSQGACTGDFDKDGDMDIYICNWFSTDYLLINNGSGIFDKLYLNLPTLNKSYQSNSASCGDMDNDGDLDLMVSTKEGNIFFYQNNSAIDMVDFILNTENSFKFDGEDAYGTLLQDFNNDGWIDCFFSLFGENKLALNDGSGSFESEFDSDLKHVSSTGCSYADLDQDGDLDIFVANKNDLSRVYLNPINDNKSIFIRLTGVVSNRDAVGTKVYFYESGDSVSNLIGFREVQVQCGYLSSCDPIVHFGTGLYQSIDVRIIFPSGNEINEHNLIPGKRYEFAEYNIVISKILFSLNVIRYNLSRVNFWVNITLIILLLAILWTYIYLGFNRYHWQAFGMATQLIVWFVVSLIIYVIFRETALHTVLIALNSVSLFGMLIVSGYAEHMRSLRIRRGFFRDKLQLLSEQMINFHSNEQLYEQVLNTLNQHDNISAVKYFINDNGELYQFNGDKQVNEKYKLIKQDADKIIQRNVVTDEDIKIISAMMQENELNICLPVKRETALFGLIGINMQNIKSPLNREDIQIIQTIANQMAIALENNNYIKESAALVKQLTESKIRDEYLKQLEKSNKALDKKNAELTRLFKELQEKEAQLIHSEKMASLGQLVAGISHELNNPISFIYANSRTLMESIEEIEQLWSQLDPISTSKIGSEFSSILSELKSIVTDNIKGSQSVKDLVLNLKNFSRLDQAEWKDAKLVPGIESSLKLLKSQIPPDIKIETRFESDPVLYCNPGQLNQVFINLISNAAQAIHGKGKISIRTFIKKNNLYIEMEDNGEGIDKNILPKIFDPFFTTKEINKGTGLGLSISYSIIEKHGGHLKVKSTKGKGSIFTIVLPMESPKIKQN
jgi:signal transduction histidine kinase